MLIYGFMAMGMQRQLVPNRWQAAVEGLTGFIDDMVNVNIGPQGKKFVPYIFSLFVFILTANLLGLFPLSIIPGQHQFTTTSHFSVTGVLAVLSFAIVLIVGLAPLPEILQPVRSRKQPLFMMPLICLIELISFMVRGRSPCLRLFVAMIAGPI